MSALALTRSQIITQGLSLAGRPDLTSDARLWLNLFLEEFYMTQDVDWLVKTSSSLSVAQGTAFPTDYRAAKSALLYDSVGASQPLQVTAKADEYDYNIVSNGGLTGRPQKVYANHDTRAFYFFPAPDTTYTWILKYFYMPTLPDYTDASTDTQTVKWGMPYSILIDHIKARAYEYNDDTRQDAAAKGVLGAIGMAKANNMDKRAGSSRINMGKSFKRRFR